MEEREPELIDYLRVIWRWKWLILLTTAASLLATAALTWRTVATYRIVATIDAGDIGDERAEDVERLVERLNAGAASRDGQQPRPTARYRKPFLVDLEVETPRPRDGVQMVQTTAGELVTELRELLRFQRGDEEARIDALRAQIEAARGEAAATVAQLRIDGDRQLTWTRARLERTTAKMELVVASVKAGVRDAADAARERAQGARSRRERVRIEQRLLERRRDAGKARLDWLRQLLGDSSREKAELAGLITHEENALADDERRLTVTLPAEAAELAREEQVLDEQVKVLDGARAGLNSAGRTGISQEVQRAQETLYRVAGPGSRDAQWLDRLADKLGDEPPVALRQLESERQVLTEQLRVWEDAVAVLRDPGKSPTASALGRVREAVYRVAAPGSPSVTFVDSAVRKVVVDIPEKLRSLGRQADELERRRVGIRSAAVVVVPEVPGAPVRPRVALNLALGLAAGLAGSVLLAFFFQYLGQHRRAPDPGGIAESS